MALLPRQRKKCVNLQKKLVLSVLNTVAVVVIVILLQLKEKKEKVMVVKVSLLSNQSITTTMIGNQHV